MVWNAPDARNAKKLKELQILDSDVFFLVWLHTKTAAFPPAPWRDIWGQLKHKEGNIIFVAMWGSCCWLVLQHKLPVCGYKSLIIWERSMQSWMALRANWPLFQEKGWGCVIRIKRRQRWLWNMNRDIKERESPFKRPLVGKIDL